MSTKTFGPFFYTKKVFVVVVVVAVVVPGALETETPWIPCWHLFGVIARVVLTCTKCQRARGTPSSLTCCSSSSSYSSFSPLSIASLAPNSCHFLTILLYATSQDNAHTHTNTHTLTHSEYKSFSLYKMRCGNPWATSPTRSLAPPSVSVSLLSPLLHSFHLPSTVSLYTVCLLRGPNNHLRRLRRLPEPSSSYSPRAGAGLGEVSLALRGGSLKVRHFLSTILQISCNLPRPAPQHRPRQKPEHILIKRSLNSKKKRTFLRLNDAQMLYLKIII